METKFFVCSSSKCVFKSFCWNVFKENDNFSCFAFEKIANLFRTDQLTAVQFWSNTLNIDLFGCIYLINKQSIVHDLWQRIKTQLI